jgi:hypothetical protein
VHKVGILAFDLANENPSISQLALEGCGLRFPARELPNFHACTTAHVQGQHSMASMHFTTSVTGHESSFGGFFEHSNVDAKCISVPFPGIVHIGDANSNLLDAADQFTHEVRIGGSNVKDAQKMCD